MLTLKKFPIYMATKMNMHEVEGSIIDFNASYRHIVPLSCSLYRNMDLEGVTITPPEFERQTLSMTKGKQQLCE